MSDDCGEDKRATAFGPMVLLRARPFVRGCRYRLSVRTFSGTTAMAGVSFNQLIQAEDYVT